MPISNIFDPTHFNPMYPQKTEEYMKKVWGKNWIGNDIARCNGVGFDEDGEWDWREGCETCLRRTATRPEYYSLIDPPAILAFECEYLIEPVTPPSSERREALLSLLEKS